MNDRANPLNNQGDTIYTSSDLLGVDITSPLDKPVEDKGALGRDFFTPIQESVFGVTQDQSIPESFCEKTNPYFGEVPTQIKTLDYDEVTNRALKEANDLLTHRKTLYSNSAKKEMETLWSDIREQIKVVTKLRKVPKKGKQALQTALAKLDQLSTNAQMTIAFFHTHDKGICYAETLILEFERDISKKIIQPFTTVNYDIEQIRGNKALFTEWRNKLFEVKKTLLADLADPADPAYTAACEKYIKRLDNYLGENSVDWTFEYQALHFAIGKVLVEEVNPLYDRLKTMKSPSEITGFKIQSPISQLNYLLKELNRLSDDGKLARFFPDPNTRDIVTKHTKDLKKNVEVAYGSLIRAKQQFAMVELLNQYKLEFPKYSNALEKILVLKDGTGEIATIDAPTTALNPETQKPVLLRLTEDKESLEPITGPLSEVPPDLVQEIYSKVTMEARLTMDQELQNISFSPHREAFIEATKAMQKGDFLQARALIGNYFRPTGAGTVLFNQQKDGEHVNPSDLEYASILKKIQYQVELKAANLLVNGYASKVYAGTKQKDDSLLNVPKMDIQKTDAIKMAFAVESFGSLVLGLVGRGHSIEDAIEIAKTFPRLKDSDFIGSIYDSKVRHWLAEYKLDKEVGDEDGQGKITLEDLEQSKCEHYRYNRIDGTNDFLSGKPPEWMNVFSNDFMSLVLEGDPNLRKAGFKKAEQIWAYDHGQYALGEFIFEQHFSNVIHYIERHTPMMTEEELSKIEPTYKEIIEKQLQVVSKDNPYLKPEDARKMLLQSLLEYQWHQKVLVRTNKLIQELGKHYNPAIFQAGFKLPHVPGVELPGNTEPLPENWHLSDYLKDLSPGDELIWKYRYDSKYKQFDRGIFGATAEEKDKMGWMFWADIAMLFPVGLVTSIPRKMVTSYILQKIITKMSLEKAFLNEARRYAVKRGLLKSAQKFTLKTALNNLSDREIIKILSKIGGNVAGKLMYFSSRLAGTVVQGPLFHTTYGIWLKSTGRSGNFNKEGYINSEVALMLFGGFETFGAMIPGSKGVGQLIDITAGLTGAYSFNLVNFYDQMGRLPFKNENVKLVQDAACFSLPMSLAGLALTPTMNWGYKIAKSKEPIPIHNGKSQEQNGVTEPREWTQIFTTSQIAMDKLKFETGAEGKRTDSMAPFAYTSKESGKIIFETVSGEKKEPIIVDADYFEPSSSKGGDIIELLDANGRFFSLPEKPYSFKLHEGSLWLASKENIIINNVEFKPGTYEILPGDILQLPKNMGPKVKVAFAKLRGHHEESLQTRVLSFEEQPMPQLKNHPLSLNVYLDPLLNQAELLNDPYYKQRIYAQGIKPEWLTDDPLYEVYTSPEARIKDIFLGEAQIWSNELVEKLNKANVDAYKGGPWIWAVRSYKDIHGRIYISVEPDYAFDVYKTIYENVSFQQFKLWGGLVRRGDTAVVYIDREKAPKILETVIDIYDYFPSEAFGWNTPLFTSTILGKDGKPLHGLAFGEQPVSHSQSFGTLRASPIIKIISNWAERNGISMNEAFTFAGEDKIQIIDEIAKGFKKRGVDPDYPVFNLGSKDYWSEIHPSLDQTNGMSHTTEYYLPKGDKK